MSERPSPSDLYDDLRRSVDRLRDTAKWILTVFAAVGAVLTAGVSLTSIGLLAFSDPRLWLALIAAIVALVSVGFAITRVVGVLTAGEVTLDGLAEDEIENNEPAAGDIRLAKETEFLPATYASVADFRNQYNQAKDNLANAESSGNETAVSIWSQVVENLGQTVMPQLFSGVRYYRVRRQFREAVRFMLIFGFVAALGIIVFAWAANPLPSSATNTPQFRTPVLGSIQLTDLGKTALSNSLGAKCVESPVQVLVLSASEIRMEVVSVPTDVCNVARFPIVDGITGSLEPEHSVELPTLTTSKSE